MPAVWYQLGRCLISTYCGKQSDRYDWRSSARCVASAWAVLISTYIVVSRAADTTGDLVPSVANPLGRCLTNIYVVLAERPVRRALSCPLWLISLGGVLSAPCCGSRAADTTGALVPAVCNQLGRCLINTYAGVAEQPIRLALLRPPWLINLGGLKSAPITWWRGGRHDWRLCA